MQVVLVFALNLTSCTRLCLFVRDNHDIAQCGIDLHSLHTARLVRPWNLMSKVTVWSIVLDSSGKCGLYKYEVCTYVQNKLVQG